MIQIVVPALGESVTEATVAKWFKNVGDAVAADEPLVELETDKVTVEVPAPASGVLRDILAAKDSVVTVGAPCARLRKVPQRPHPAQQLPSRSLRRCLLHQSSRPRLPLRPCPLPRK